MKSFFHHYFGGLGRRISEYHIMILGGGLAFSVLLCIVPLVLVIISILGSILQASSVEDQIGTFIDTIIPHPQFAGYVKGIIYSRIDEVIAHKKLAGYLGVVGLLVASSSLFSSMRTVLNTIFEGSAGKPMFVGKLRDIGMLFLVLAFFLISTAILPLLEIIKESALKLGVSEYLGIQALLGSSFSIASYAIVFFMFFVIYYLIPYEPLGRRVRCHRKDIRHIRYGSHGHSLDILFSDRLHRGRRDRATVPGAEGGDGDG
jgi:YihY family inner membrane protein